MAHLVGGLLAAGLTLPRSCGSAQISGEAFGIAAAGTPENSLNRSRGFRVCVHMFTNYMSGHSLPFLPLSFLSVPWMKHTPSLLLGRPFHKFTSVNTCFLAGLDWPGQQVVFVHPSIWSSIYPFKRMLAHSSWPFIHKLPVY